MGAQRTGQSSCGRNREAAAAGTEAQKRDPTQSPCHKLKKPVRAETARLAHVAVHSNQPLGRYAHQIECPYRPHREHGTNDSALAPSARRGDYPRSQARDPACALHAARELKILANRKIGEAAQRIESLAADENGLISRRRAA